MPTVSVSPQPGPLQFVDIAASLGVVFQYANGEQAGHFSILESLGGGVAVLDLDADDRMDLCFPGGGTIDAQLQCGGLPSGLFRQQPQGGFQSVASAARLPVPAFYTHCAAVCDYNSDGFTDLLITGFRGWQLLANQGDGTLMDVTAHCSFPAPSWGAAAVGGDLNADGLDDLYVVNYVDWSAENHPLCEGHTTPRDVCSPRRFQGLPDQLLVNRGDGTFDADLATRSGQLPGKGLSALLADLNGDRLPDIYVCNDTVPNQLLENQGALQFREVAAESGVAVNERGLPDGSMGVELLDYDGNQCPDLWVSNYENELLALYRCEAPGLYLHVSQSAGLAAIGRLAVSWGTSAFDADLDGHEDVFVANGHVQRFPFNSTVTQAPFLFHNISGQRFLNRAAAAGAYTSGVHQGRGCAVVDLDRDGDLDIAVSHVNEPVALLQNQSPPRGSWLQLQLIGTSSARCPLGTTAELQTSQGQRLLRQLTRGGSYASSREQALHFGIPSSDPVQLTVRWPDGSSQTWPAVQVNQRLLLVQNRDPLPAP